MAMQLPDIFETRQVKAFRDALMAGDLEQAKKIEDHLLAEAATSPEDREVLADQLRAAMLFRAYTDASGAGDEATALVFRGLLETMCSPKTVETTLMSGLLYAGLQQGSLPAEHHDRLTEWMGRADVGDAMREHLQGITRVP
ncbi:hypothetical protein IAG42_37420 (plasmid) [Streptomyces xanthii]|uniref:Uncharacterized protein n=2 Tax=Streptomyces xanthii TaxID=2768069 RepID=A0A7H1BL39_9ACTN|nr:hypothetical protein [Streptomyces xanthii]QNS09444.1 hypothetical protein IAG42_37420 [Streptomyces xanthii]